MTAIATLATANGMAKKVFGSIINAVPDNIRLLDYTKFEAKNKLGEKLSEVVFLSGENGFTYNTTAATGFALNASVVAVSAELNLSGGEILLRSQSSYKVFSSLASEGQAAFASYYKKQLANMRSSHMKRLECNAHHGGRSIAQLASISGTSTTRALVVAKADWAPWLWTGSEGATLDAYKTTTIQNDSSGSAVYTIVSVDFLNRVINISGESSDCTALDTGTTTVELYWAGSYGNESIGLINAVSNTGTLYGISAATYGLWAGNTVTVTGNLTWDRVQEGIAEACGKGLDENVVLEVSIPTWSTLNSDITALRRIDSGYSKTKTSVGTSAIEFQSMNGTVEVVASGSCKGGEAFFFPKGEVARVGSTDATFELPGLSQGEIFKYVDGFAAVEMQCYADSAVICRAPSKGCLFTGITND